MAKNSSEIQNIIVEIGVQTIFAIRSQVAPDSKNSVLTAYGRGLLNGRASGEKEGFFSCMISTRPV